MATQPQPRLTSAEYLARERACELWGDAGQLTLPSIDCTLSLSDVYHKVTFGQG